MKNKKKHVILRKLSFAMLAMLCLTACGGSKAPSEKVVSEDLKAALAEKNEYATIKNTKVEKSLTEKGRYEITYDVEAETKYSDWNYQVNLHYTKYDQGWSLDGTDWISEEYEQVRYPSAEELEALVNSGEDENYRYIDDLLPINNGKVDYSDIAETGVIVFNWQTEEDLVYGIRSKDVTVRWKYDVKNDTWKIYEDEKGQISDVTYEDALKPDADLSGTWDCQHGTYFRISDFSEDSLTAVIDGKESQFKRVEEPWGEMYKKTYPVCYYDGEFYIAINFEYIYILRSALNFEDWAKMK